MKITDRLKHRWGRMERPIKDLLARLSPSQRISLGLLGVTVMVLLILLMVTAPSAVAEKIYVPADADGLMKKDLDANDIPYEFDEKRNAFAIDYQYRARVHSLQIANPLYDTNEDLFKWLYKETSWTETSGQRNQMVLDTTRKRVEAAIEALPKVSSAVVVPQVQRGSIFVTSKAPSTASVTLKTTDHLDNKLASGIRKFVAFAFGMTVDNVTLMDQFGLIEVDGVYAVDEATSARRGDYERMMARHLSLEFSPRDYVVTVAIDVDRSSSIVNSKAFDLDKSASLKKRLMRDQQESSRGNGAPGVKPNVVQATADASATSITTSSSREETEFENRFGETDEEKQIPAGTVRKITIMATISYEAIVEQIRLLRGEPDYTPPKSEIDGKVDELEKALESLPAEAGSEVKSTVRAVALRSIALPEAKESLAMLGLLQLHAREIVLAVLSIFGCLMLYRVASKSVPDLETLPDPVADLQRFLEEKEERDRLRALELAEEEDGQPAPVQWEASDEDREAIELLSAVAEFATERPDIAAGVLKNWLSEPNPPDAAESEPRSESS